MCLGPSIYKPGQGYWTRTMSAIAFGALTLMGGDWTRQQFGSVKIGNIQTVYVQWTAFVVVSFIAGLILYYFIGKKQKTVDFMIATEGELKKVNWSSRKEIFGMTWVVIGLTIFIALIVSLFDYAVFGPFFRFIKVIDLRAVELLVG